MAISPNGTEYPKTEDGQIDVDAIKELFMGSPYLDWTRFAEAQGWHRGRARPNFPVKTWQDEKRKIIAEREADQLAGMMFDRRFKWHKDVIKTLDEYPKASDSMMFLLRGKMQEWNEYLQEWAIAKKEKQPRPKGGWAFEKITANDMRTLSSAIKDITDSKYRSLLIHDWNITKMKDDSSIGDIDENQAAKGLVLKVMGGQEMTIAEIQKMMDQYIDEPQPDIIDISQSGEQIENIVGSSGE